MTFSDIVDDLTPNKEACHLNLKAMSYSNQKAFDKFTKAQLKIISQCYGLHVLSSHTKKKIIDALRTVLESDTTMSQPE